MEYGSSQLALAITSLFVRTIQILPYYCDWCNSWHCQYAIPKRPVAERCVEFTLGKLPVMHALDNPFPEYGLRLKRKEMIHAADPITSGH